MTKKSETTDNNKAINYEPLLCPVFDDENEDEYLDEEPDYYTCMCCGNVQKSGISCSKCCGPMREEYY